MYTLDEQPRELALIVQGISEVSNEIAAALTPSASGVKLEGNQDIFAPQMVNPKFYRLTEGALRHVVKGKELFMYEAGDFVGYERIFSVESFSVKSDFAVIVNEYDRESAQRKIQQDPNFALLMCRYHALRVSFSEILLAQRTKVEAVEALPVVKYFEPGEVIVKEGDTSTDVLNLLEGSAEVFLLGKKVGDVARDEIFGAIASLCNRPRTATVIAKERCVVLELKSQEFQLLIERRPQAVLKLIQDMAKTIVELNERVVRSAP